MPIPLGGLVPVAEYGSVFEADVATQRLPDEGIAATTSYDPALNSVAPYLASDRTVEVLVHPDDVERALRLLEADPLAGLPDAFQDPPPAVHAVARPDPGARRHQLRWVAVVVLAALALPIVVSLVTLIFRA